jgi:hypothetical protein
MGKRADHDATMELSTSQLVPDKPAVNHDASVWAGKTVGSEQFAPAPKPRGNKNALVILILFLLFTAGAAAGIYFSS